MIFRRDRLFHFSVSGQKVKANLLANKAYFCLCREEHIKRFPSWSDVSRHNVSKGKEFYRSFVDR
jgi:hypothetical protein